MRRLCPLIVTLLVSQLMVDIARVDSASAAHIQPFYVGVSHYVVDGRDIYLSEWQVVCDTPDGVDDFIAWQNLSGFASRQVYLGMQGYLVTELNCGGLPISGWLGAKKTAGGYMWVDGPKAGQPVPALVSVPWPPTCVGLPTDPCDVVNQTPVPQQYDYAPYNTYDVLAAGCVSGAYNGQHTASSFEVSLGGCANWSMGGLGGTNGVFWIEYTPDFLAPPVSVPGDRARPLMLAVGARPNPVEAATNICFDMPTGGRARVSVFDPFGRRVAMLLDAETGPGSHRLFWPAIGTHGERLRGGVYLVRAEVAGHSASSRMVVIR